MMHENDVIPLSISIIDSTGVKVAIKDLLKDLTVLYFYPKDDTEGCTLEACEFRDFNTDIEKLGVKIMGISKDSVKSHTKFTNKYKLNFPIFSDPEHELQDAFGVWGEKTMFGRKYMGTKRTTFLLDKSGKILKLWDNVKPQGHAKVVLEFLKTFLKKKNSLLF